MPFSLSISLAICSRTWDCAQQSLQYEHYQHNLSYLEEFLSEGKPTYYSGFLEEVQQFLGGVVEQKLKL